LGTGSARVVVEVHDERALWMKSKIFSRSTVFEITAEQDPQLKGTTIFSVFAFRRR